MKISNCLWTLSGLFAFSIAARAAATASAAVGQTATFSVTAAGTPPFNYQWIKEATPISGATAATYVLSPLKIADAGNYKVTVLNSAGSTVSDVASLTVTSVVVGGGGSTAGTDLSKFTVQAGLGAIWTPPVGQWDPTKGGLAVVPLKKKLDLGNHFDDTTGTYTVGTGEAGFYEIHMVARATDQPPPYLEIGITAGIDNLDESSKFDMAPGPGAGYVHFTVEHTNWRLLKDGAKLRCNLFISQGFTIQSFDVTFTLIYLKSVP